MTTTAFVAGATGLTGRYLTRALRERNIETYAHVRPDSVRLPEWRERFSAWGAEVDTTAWDEAQLTQRLARTQPELVFALLGTTRARGRRTESETGRPDTYESVDYGLTSLLLRATRASCSTARFVYLSAIGVSEGTSNAYYAARWKLEQELRQSGLRYTVVRPSFIIGERDDPRLGERVGSKVTDAALGFLGALGAKHLRNRYRSITGPELAEALVRLALDPAAENRVVLSEELT
jgi:uncharacterized protein YbjT (DUF2867 family)